MVLIPGLGASIVIRDIWSYVIHVFYSLLSEAMTKKSCMELGHGWTTRNTGRLYSVLIL